MKHITPAAARPLWPSAPLLLRPFDRTGTAVAARSVRSAISGATTPGDLRRGFPVGMTLAVALGTILSLAPGLLPRTAAAQAVLTSVLVVALLGIARLTGFLFSRRRRNTPGRHLPRRKLRSRIGGASGTLLTGGPFPATAAHPDHGRIAPVPGLPNSSGPGTAGIRRALVASGAAETHPGPGVACLDRSIAGAERTSELSGEQPVAPSCRGPNGRPPAAPMTGGAIGALGDLTSDGASVRPAGGLGNRATDRPSGTLANPRIFTRRPWGVRTGRLRRTVSNRFAGVPTGRHLVLATTAVGVVASILHAASWQNTLRDAMGVARIGPEYWSFWAAGSLVLTIVLVAGVSTAGRLLRRIGWSRGVATTVVATLPVAFFGIPGIAAASGGSADSGLVQPGAMTRSGSAESLVSWDSLGREGQGFVTNGPAGAVRVYVGLKSAPDLASRAELAVRELDRAGGFDRADLVIAVPTGSGWVDARALRGFGERFGADFAVTALQYSQLPSWATFVLGRDSATASARALFTAIEDHAATLPNPPRLHLYGQSLGALGGSAVFAGAAEQNRRVCSVLWAGMPGGGGREPGARTAVLANSSDPVVHWSPDLLWRPPDLTGVRRDAPAPGWLPVASFVQTTADLLGSLSAPPGHGHRYDVDQGTALPGCE
ncbi:alpha/beta-hydrolase family protein [Nocardia flavorosea]|uniref:alpha/beta-hydrolase family protein n=1 Tax=Nocardia flavorosea TaxID=53429 RepID=UPI00245733E9|nr:alpha/beta-hydrolase family protein [Nocardia flavorosea]